MLVRIPYDRTAERVAELLVGRKMETLSEFLCNSVTWDQGKEMAKPPTSPFEPRCPFTSPDPHSPWQRGSNENTNGLLRPYFGSSLYQVGLVRRGGLTGGRSFR